MNQLSLTVLSVFLMACVAPQPPELNKQPTATQVQTVAPRPPQVTEVFPGEDSTHTSVQSIGARLNFRLGEEADFSSLQLFVDGVDVTSQARIGSTRDLPPSHVNISYTPNFSDTGRHRAEVRFQTQDGRTKSYSWSFSIKSP